MEIKELKTTFSMLISLILKKGKHKVSPLDNLYRITTKKWLINEKYIFKNLNEYRNPFCVLRAFRKYICAIDKILDF